LSHIDSPPKVIMVTSSVPGEGKTTFATSLAATLMNAGSRVVLLDLDLRHPSVGREIEAASRGNLVRYMMGEKGRDELIIRDEASGIDTISVSKPASNPTSILSSTRMRELLVELRDLYDFVIVDSTPVLGVSDSKLTTELVDCVLFCVRWEKSTYDMVGDALKELHEIRAPVAGAVITQVEVDRHAKYGYGGIDSYYSKYNKYYVD